MAYDFDIVVIGGGPAGYAAAIRAAQLKKRTLCIEKDKLGGICLNWGCIPTKALLTNAHFVELINNHGSHFGYSGAASWDFAQMIKRSRNVAGQLNKGIEGLFRKYKVSSKFGVAKVITPHIVQVNGEAISAESIVIATGVRPRPLPGADYDGKTIISYKEAMSLATRPQSMLIIGGGPIGLEFGYFYNAIGTKVTVVELLDRILPGEDDDISAALEKSLTKRGLTILTGSKTTKVEKTGKGIKAELETPKGKVTVEADLMLVAIGVLGNVEGLTADEVKLEIVKNHIKADPQNGYVTSVPGIYAVGDVIGPPWLAHVAHHEAVACIERLCGFADRAVDYTNIPGCTYTDPGVASVGLDGESGQGGRPRGAHWQVSLQFQRQGPGVGRDRGVCEARLRRPVRRTLGSPLDRLSGHRDDRRAGARQEAGGHRGGNPPRHASPPDIFRGNHGSRRSGILENRYISNN